MSMEEDAPKNMDKNENLHGVGGNTYRWSLTGMHGNTIDMGLIPKSTTYRLCDVGQKT